MAITRRGFIKGSAAITVAAAAGIAVDGVMSEADEVKSVMSLCPYCGNGCGMYLEVKDGKVVNIRGMEESKASKGKLCILGLTAHEMLTTENRLKYPLIKKNGKLERAGWDEAVELIGRRFKEIIEKNGPDAMGVYHTASFYNEEYYLLNKLVKGGFGTNNLDGSARLCYASTVAAFVKVFGGDVPFMCYEDIDLADCFIISGYNMSSSNPVAFDRIIQRKNEANTALIVIDPRATMLAQKADIHLQIKPGTDIALNNALAYVLFKEGFVNEEKVSKYASGLQELKTHVRKYTPEYAEGITGVSREKIVKAAVTYGRAKNAVTLWMLGLNQSTVGVWKIASLWNLSLITGNIGRPGAGPLSITGQGTAMSLREIGGLPHLLPAHRAVANERHRKEIAGIWRISPDKISPRPGKTAIDMFDAVGKGEIKGLWILQANPAATAPDTNKFINDIKKAEFIVIQDAFHPTETTLLADVILPAAQWAEKDGTASNAERGVNIAKKAVEPPGEAKPDTEIIMMIGKKMGYENLFPYETNEDIFEEWKICTKGQDCDMTGITYRRMAKEFGVQWPCLTPEDPGVKRRFLDLKFPTQDGRAILNICEYKAPAETTDAEYPFVLITGLAREHFHSRTRTANIPRLARAVSHSFVDISPSDANKYRIRNGDVVKVSSRRGAIKVKARVSEDIQNGAVFVPYHFGYLAGDDKSANLLTHQAYDPISKQPEYKACAVKIEKA